MKTAYSYLRVSGQSQIDGDGFPRQRDTILKYARQNGITLGREFVEQGVSGTKDAFDREALPALMDSLKLNGITLVLIEKADRLARDLMVSEILLAEFRKAGVTVISAECGTDLTVDDENPTKKFIRQVLGAVSELEKSGIVAKLRAARQRVRKETGRCEGRKPYGHTNDEKGILIYMTELRAKGFSYHEIAVQLNMKGIQPRKGYKWHPATICRILYRENKVS